MLLKTAFREIKTSLGRYLAILAIIALGVGFFAGLRVTRTAMISTANHYDAAGEPPELTGGTAAGEG